MPQSVDAAKNLAGGDIAPAGQRVVLEARGDLWSVPVKNGSPRNMTRTSGVAERDPSWSPDGKWIAYFADITGEYELYIKQSDGKGETRRLTEDGEAYRYAPTWSGDSKHIVFTDKTGLGLLAHDRRWQDLQGRPRLASRPTHHQLVATTAAGLLTTRPRTTKRGSPRSGSTKSQTGNATR